MMKKRIGINLLSFTSVELTGVGNFFKRLFEALPPLEDVEFIFFYQKSFPFKDVFRIPPGVEARSRTIRNLGSKSARIWYEQFILPFLCGGLDVLYSPCVANPILPLPAKKITTIYDLTPFYVREKYGFWQGLYVRAMTWLLAKVSGSIVTISESSKKDLIDVLGADPSKVTVIYAFTTERNTAHIRYEPFFLTVGTRQPAKNLPGVIRAFSLFSQRYDTVGHRLIIVGGSGWADSGDAALVKRLGMEEKIEFAGYISDEQLNVLYSRCKGHILLSLYEGFGIPILEALAWCKPSVASNISSMPEVLGTTGIAVDPRDEQQAALAIKAIAEAPFQYLDGADYQLEKFSSGPQVRAWLRVLGINP